MLVDAINALIHGRIVDAGVRPILIGRALA
jgi:hypothetical protein